MRRQAFWLTIAFIFTVPWEAALQLGAGSRGSRLLGLVAAMVWAISVVVRGRVRRLDAFVKAYFVFLLWSGLTLLWSISPDSSFSGFITYTQIFGMILIIWDLFETEKHVETALQAFVLGAYISCASVVVNWATAPPPNSPEHHRINALGFETDGIALIIALAIPAAWYLATGPNSLTRSRLMTVVNFVYVPTAVFAVILTGTRGAAVASFPTLVFILWSLRRSGSRRRFVAWTMLGFGVLGVMLFAPPEMVQRIGGSVTDVLQGDSLSGRRDIWTDSLETLADHPVAGVGLDAHRAASLYDKEAHNTIISILVESGIIGFLLFLAIAIALLTRLTQLDGVIGAYWKAQIAVIAIGAMSLSLEDTKSVWILSSLAVVTAVAIRNEMAKPLPERSMLPSVWGAGTTGREIQKFVDAD